MRLAEKVTAVKLPSELRTIERLRDSLLPRLIEVVVVILVSQIRRGWLSPGVSCNES